MNALLQKIKAKYSAEDFQFINYAVDFAAEKHHDQKRVSGEPYILHPLHVAVILAELGMDVICVSAAILHDVLEDTDCTEAEFKKKFGQEIYNLVEGVTKLSRYNYNSIEEAQAENYRKLLFATVKDIRVIFIKLADRLHNMRTLEPLNELKRKRISVETMEIYAPLAGRLGMANIKSELEDLCFKNLYPDEYKNLAEKIVSSRDERMSFVMLIASEIEVALSERGIKGEVKGRPKHLYSIYKKMKTQHKTLEQIYDLIAVRVIVESETDCYMVLGIIHSKWKPIQGRFKDYIAMPKPNLYQSLHTTVVTNFGQAFEIQIRTYEMNITAEYGIAAHWLYKEKNDDKKKKEYYEKLSWVQEAIEADEIINDSHDFITNIKLNVSNNEIYVFTPKGAVINLPKGSTCIDFAYKVHSAVGNKCAGAKLNNKIVPLSTVLDNGDVIEILTTGKGPSRDWLKFVTTSQAKSKIKAYFKKALVVENIKTGKDMLEKEAKRRGYNLNELMSLSAIMDKLYQRYGLSSNEDMFASVGYGGLTTNQIIIKLIDNYNKEQALKGSPAIIADTVINPIKKHGSRDITIEGHDDFLIKLSKCCNPVPGDEIIGYAARGTGVSIHRKDCPNVKGMETERLMDARWSGVSDTSFFETLLTIECVDKNGFLNQIISLVSAQGYSITTVAAHTKRSEQKAIINLGIKIKNIKDIEYIINKLNSLSGIISINRNK